MSLRVTSVISEWLLVTMAGATKDRCGPLTLLHGNDGGSISRLQWF